MKLLNQTTVLFILLLVLPSLACGRLDTPPAATPEPTNTSTPLPTATATLKPTATTVPTKTTIPPTPTAAPVGVTVSNGDYEVDVLKVRKLGSVYLDSNYVWNANPGYLFLELGVKVTNLKPGSNVNVYWGDIYVIEDTGDTWFPGWGGFQTTNSGTEIHPASIIFSQMRDGNTLVSFDEVVYLRLIWTITDNNPSTVLFGFGNSPLIEVTID